ncbi:polysaccharide deacetylase family protein [Pseudonocardia spinosispora]|uniref:polysaccharide deacetylase family protein n=1 Tax=Pseudonocardia spinosispora TaxID=103441 RepID=UPI00041B526A|nr:polysaccharide deacetylase family protein [Pseudonocardia spinosispora]
MRRWITAVGVVLLVAVAVSSGLWWVTNARGFQLFGDLVDRVDTADKVVALTFDDGPAPAGTQPLLDVVASRRVPATFYLIGSDLRRNPELGARIAAAGHEIGNHTYSHRRMVFVSGDVVASEIERTDELIRRTGYRGDITFRPPNGKKFYALPHYLGAHHRLTVTWDVEPNSDPETDAHASAIVEWAATRVRPGSIILLHGMYPSREQTRLAVGPLIDRLHADGYRFVTVSDLLGHRAAG